MSLLAQKVKSLSKRSGVPPCLCPDKRVLPVVAFSDDPFCPVEAMLGPQMPRASMVCGLGLGFPALYSKPALTVPGHLGLCGKGQYHCPAGVVLDFSRGFWGHLYSLIPIGSADMAASASYTPGLQRRVWSGSLGWGCCLCLRPCQGHGSQPRGFCRIPSCPCVCFLLPPRTRLVD